MNPSSTAPRPRLDPTAPADRFLGLDVVRGFALFGILVINMRYFAVPMAGRALNNPNLPGGHFVSSDFWSWFGANLLFEDKMMAMFSVLFGAGIWLMKDRGIFLHYRRMFWLLLIGTLHASVLWFGDILTLYALCGMVIVGLRRLPAPLLVVIGLSAYLYAIGHTPFQAMVAESTRVEEVAPEPTEGVDPAPAGTDADSNRAEGDARPTNPEEPTGSAETARGADAGETSAPQETEIPPEPAPAAPAPQEEEAPELSLLDRLGAGQSKSFSAHFNPEAETAMHEGSWRGQWSWRITLLPWWQGAGFVLGGIWWNGGLMVLGMGLMGLGYLSGRQSWGTYLSLGFASMALGIAISSFGVWPQTFGPLGRESVMWMRGQEPIPDGLLRLYRTAATLRGLSTPLVMFGWASLLLWMNRIGLFHRLLKPLAAVGRMALTNYLMHTVICVLIFEGWAFGSWNQVRYLDQMKLVALICAAQLVLCPLWLKHFRFGPMEWVWRSLSYWRPQPMRRVLEPTPAEAEQVTG